MPRLPELVIFDCDGVLVDSEPVTNEVLAQDLISRGLDISPADCHRLFGGGTIRGAGEAAAELGADIPSDWVDQYYEKMYTALARGVPLVTGVMDVLNALDEQGIATGIVSKGPERKMQATLGPHGLWERFQGRIFSAHTYGVAKPDPGLVNFALEHFDVPPEQAVLIDDSPSGCKAGAAAGVRTIGYAEQTDPARLRDVIDHIAFGMGEILALLKKFD